jgi:hypothetical protein
MTAPGSSYAPPPLPRACDIRPGVPSQAGCPGLTWSLDNTLKTQANSLIVLQPTKTQQLV